MIREFFCKLKIVTFIQTPKNKMARHFTTHATKNFQRWSKSDDATLKTMIRAGFNSEEIAMELKRTRASIMGRKSYLGIQDKLTPARGSKMPYVSFSKNLRTPYEKAAETPEVETLVESAPSKPTAISSIGNSIDEIISRAKEMGLKVNISISSEL